MVDVQRVFVSLDCEDPQPLAEFWASLLGGEIVFTTAQAVGVRTDHLWLSALRVDDHRPPTWPSGEVPKQIHLDLGVEDLDAAEADAAALGAVRAGFQPAPDARRILLDPAGHPFCLTARIPRVAEPG